MGKGSKQRPREVDHLEFCKNWERIFGDADEMKAISEEEYQPSKNVASEGDEPS